MLTVVGLMSGTSMDGVDAALLSTDGSAIGAFGPRLFRAYTDSERAVLRQALDEARRLDDRAARTGVLAEAERLVTNAHGEAVERVLAENPDVEPDLVGFHGQTVFHAAERRMTVQIGDGPLLARRLGMPVVYDFRAADVAAGGQGAPFVPLYHQALARHSDLGSNVAVVNIGGVANVTRVGEDGSLVAGDTGPGNALIDDLVRERTGEPMDRRGALAAKGRVDRGTLDRLLDNPWFALPMPKSLDRNAFSSASVRDMALEDAVATLAAFTAETIARGIAVSGGADRIVVCGGGSHNPTLLRMLAAAANCKVSTAAEIGWAGDFVEAEAFAFLAARSLAGLPLSLPTTTGVPRPMPGGVVARP
ncbi:MAG: anhydro-N-acetylmuramic acid kinase [Bauldia sp.]